MATRSGGSKKTQRLPTLFPKKAVASGWITWPFPPKRRTANWPSDSSTISSIRRWARNCPNFDRFPTPNRAAHRYINPDDLKNPAIYPTAEMMGKLEFTHDLGDQTKLYDELWMQIKAR